LLAIGCGERKPQPQAWQAVPLGTAADFRGIWFADPNTGWIVGGAYNVAGGLLGRTTDGGKTWRFSNPVPTRARVHVTAVHFFDARRGLIAASDGEIYATADGGDNWANVHSAVPRRHGLTAFSFVDGERGWAVGLGIVLRTRDGGQRWDYAVPRQRGDERIDAWTIQFVDESHGWIAGMHGTLRSSDDGGLTWERAQTPLAPERPNLPGLFFIDDGYGWVVGEQGTVLATHDGGRSWTRQDIGIAEARAAPKPERFSRDGKVEMIDTADRTPGLTLTAVRFVDRNRGWAAGYYAGLGRSLIIRTDNGGATWVVDAEIAGEELRTMFLDGGGTLWAIGTRVREGVQSIYRRAAWNGAKVSVSRTESNAASASASACCAVYSASR
jgi:photosystem II stability/assembly factor-like uncharacterized protein